MSASLSSPPSSCSLHVTRIARRRILPGKESAYEGLIREMVGKMRTNRGFLSAELIPPEEVGGEYQFVVNFASEADLQLWDVSPARGEIQQRMRAVADVEPEYRVLSGLEAWFAPVVVPASMHPPRLRMAVVTWLGIFPTVSLFLWLLAPLLESIHFLLRTAILTILIVITMTWLVMPRLTKLLRGWINPGG